MYLGLDLRGGVHFLLQVDMAGALNKKLDSDAADARAMLRDKNIRDGGVNRVGQSVVVNFADQAVADDARLALAASVSELQWATRQGGRRLSGRRHVHAGGAKARRRWRAQAEHHDAA